ncbi:hypothetical protein SH668x_002784 [Planctomicrobium sp. SH668]|uniref:hypothetical protein n=1 Tax=Planctomicrobium sp. SH668 TaxID=3448126 RepID=UPI003F5B61B1
MRLTLRTILAYLDDVLEPAQAREIGEKIAESPDAVALMNRLKDVIRRRRIGAPELAGPGSGPDPNIVSDYFENVLSPSQVVELERLCQSSDLHLAEVAACHKILSLVMSQPIDVSDSMKDRMYALGTHKTPGDTPSSGDIPAPMAEGMSAVRTESESRLPEYLTRRSSFPQKYGAITVVALIGLAWATLLATDKSLWTRSQANRPVAQIDDSKEEANALPEPEKNPVPGPPAVQVVDTVPIDDSGLPTESVLDTEMGLMEDGEETEEDLSSVGEMPLPPEETEPEMPAPAKPQVVEGERFPEFDFRYQEGDDVTIQRDAGSVDWLLHSGGIDSAVGVGDEFAIPAPFQGLFEIDGRVEISLSSGARVLRTPRLEKTILGLALNRGHITIKRPITENEPIAVNLNVAQRDWVIEFLDPETEIASQVTLPIPKGQPGPNTTYSVDGGLVVLSGRVRVTGEGGEPIELTPSEGYARWPAAGTQLVVGTDQSLPSWAMPVSSIVTPAMKQLAKLYQKEFLPGRTIVQCIGPVTLDKRAGISELAVKTMAIIDEYHFTVPALKSEHQESRLAAIEGVRQWLIMSPDHPALLNEELKRGFREESIGTLEKMLWGFPDSDAHDPAVSRQLIDWMSDEHIAIRQLAFEFVSRVVGKTYDYMPMAPIAERRAAIQRWEDYVKRSGGTLLPATDTEPQQ